MKKQTTDMTLADISWTVSAHRPLAYAALQINIDHSCQDLIQST